MRIDSLFLMIIDAKNDMFFLVLNSGTTFFLFLRIKLRLDSVFLKNIDEIDLT